MYAPTEDGEALKWPAKLKNTQLFRAFFQQAWLNI